MIFLMTIDVERISFADNAYHDNIATRVANEGLPKLLKLFEKHNVKATFYSTAKYTKLQPKSLIELVEKGNEIGCHGYDHSEFYDVMNYQEQVEVLKISKKIIEDIIEQKIFSFRSPALRINKDTVKALETVGFKTDSSVASQRFDGPFTSGALKKLAWLTANRKPYFMSYINPNKSGYSNVLEVPVSAIIWPFIGTHMRISPFITNIVHTMLMFESKITNKPIIFLFHPNECLTFERGITNKRGNIFNGQLRHKAKMRNLGDNAISLLENMIIKAKNHGAEFMTIKDYYNQYKK